MAFEPAPIKKLNEDVINRIAAGEVVQRPANALKELIENCLDAQATNIQVTVKEGGLKLLQIQDNGTGIRKTDFDIVCERFTTSKLREFEDLHKISTYGFRGEALASISHIAHLSIISKTKNDICAYQANFVDGKLQCPPKPTAGNQGTILIVEDLFYNMSVRKKALRSPAEEYQKISEVVSKYAVHNASVGFALKKSNENNDIRTVPNSSHIENIRIIYGNTIARELIEFNLENVALRFKVKGYMTNVNYSTKKFQFLLFINHRLVDCQSLKKCIDCLYQTYLPKNAHPFVYLSLELDPNNIDINVHPTKHEVHFLNEEQIIDSIATALESKLLGSNNSRVFYTKAKLPTFHIETKENLKDKETSKPVYAKEMVRTDFNEQKLEKFFGVTVKKSEIEKAKAGLNISLTEEELAKRNKDFLKRNEKFEDICLDKTEEVINLDEPPFLSEKRNYNNKEIVNHNEIVNSSVDIVDETLNETLEDNHEPSQKCIKKNSANLEAKSPEKADKPLNKHLIAKITKVDTNLASIQLLRKSVEEHCHRTLRETFAQHVFVGPIYPTQALIQYGTKLLLCNTKTILAELFYQLILYNFQNFEYYKFEKPLSIKGLALIFLDLPETGWTEEDGPKDELAQRITEILTEKGPMLRDYFSMEISENGGLMSLPILLDNYVPDSSCLPMFIVRLSTEVNWETEKECFESFARETAKFYSNVSTDVDSNGKDWKWVTEYVLYPAIKEFFIPPKTFTENAAILEIANLPDLYKVFERC